MYVAKVLLDGEIESYSLLKSVDLYCTSIRNISSLYIFNDKTISMTKNRSSWFKQSTWDMCSANRSLFCLALSEFPPISSAGFFKLFFFCEFQKLINKYFSNEKKKFFNVWNESYKNSRRVIFPGF